MIDCFGVVIVVFVVFLFVVVVVVGGSGISVNPFCFGSGCIGTLTASEGGAFG